MAGVGKILKDDILLAKTQEDIALAKSLRKAETHLHVHHIAEEFVEEGGLNILYDVFKQQAKKRESGKISRPVVLGAVRAILHILRHISLLKKIDIDVDQEVFSITMELTFEDPIQVNISDTVYFLLTLIEMLPYKFRLFHNAVIDSCEARNLIPYSQFLDLITHACRYSPDLKNKILSLLNVTMRHSQIDSSLTKQLISFLNNAEIQKTLEKIQPFFSSETDRLVFTEFSRTFNEINKKINCHIEDVNVENVAQHPFCLSKTIHFMKILEEKQTAKLQCEIEVQRTKVCEIQYQLEIESQSKKPWAEILKTENARTERLQTALRVLRNGLISTTFQLSETFFLLPGVHAASKKKKISLAEVAILKILKDIRQKKIAPCSVQNSVSKEEIIKTLLDVVQTLLANRAEQSQDPKLETFLSGRARRQSQRRKQQHLWKEDKVKTIKCNEDVMSETEVSTPTITPTTTPFLSPLMNPLSPLAHLPSLTHCSNRFSPLSAALSPLGALSPLMSPLSPKFSFIRKKKKTNKNVSSLPPSRPSLALSRQSKILSLGINRLKDSHKKQFTDLKTTMNTLCNEIIGVKHVLDRNSRTVCFREDREDEYQYLTDICVDTEDEDEHQPDICDENYTYRSNRTRIGEYQKHNASFDSGTNPLRVKVDQKLGACFASENTQFQKKNVLEKAGRRRVCHFRDIHQKKLKEHKYHQRKHENSDILFFMK